MTERFFKILKAVSDQLDLKQNKHVSSFLTGLQLEIPGA